MIKIKNISKSFTKERKILNNISFEINRGDVLAIIGQSGTGKSVLLKHMNGLLFPDVGEIDVDGSIINKLSFEKLQLVRKNMAMVFQFGALLDSMNVSDNIRVALDNLTNLDKIEKITRIKESLSLVNLDEVEEMFPSDLSGGMKKRVGIARAISIQPKYILFDEPTTGLDPINTDKMISLIKNVNKKYNTTSVIVTHEMRIVNELANKVLMLHEGEIIFYGTPEKLNSTNNKYINYFILGHN